MSAPSTLSHPSYTDDTPLPFHLPSPHPPIPTSPTTTTYSGSYIDDYLDLLPSTAHFNPRNRAFHHPRTANAAPAPWNEHIARAVAGDAQRSLVALRRVGGVEVRVSNEEERRKEEGVRVKAPVKWGTFVIRDGGRVVVVGAEGEFDSGGGGGDEVEVGKRWVRGVETASSRKKSDRDERRAGMAGQHEYLPPVLETGLFYEDDDALTVSQPATPTSFLMTGGLSGWPSRTASPMSRSPTVPHTITWASTWPLSPSTYKRTKSVSSTSSITGWPSPARSRSSSTNPATQNRAKQDSRQSTHSSRQEQKGASTYSPTPPHPHYDPPAFVEVIYDPPSPSPAHSQPTWDNDANYKDTKRTCSDWASMHRETIDHCSHASVGSDVGWGGRSVRDPGWDFDSKGSENGDEDEESWDGFERRKTASEVSVVGSGSVRGSEGSWGSRNTQGAHISRSGESRKQAGWDTS